MRFKRRTQRRLAHGRKRRRRRNEKKKRPCCSCRRASRSEGFRSRGFAMTYRAPVPEMLFMMRHVGELGRAIDDGLYPDLSLDVVENILQEAARFSAEVLAPINHAGDRHGARLCDGAVTTAPGFKEAYQAWIGGGWNALAGPAEYGGQDLPLLLNAGCSEMWNGACLAFGVAPLLTFGGVEALAAHGSEDLKQRYLEKLVAGEWTATMNLTEPQAGSDLSAIRTRAEPCGDGSYRISGQKIFISYGEHDLTDNIIHFVLARLPDAPKGTRGISLFLVPKILPDGSRNDVRCSSLEHKLGIHASPTCTMIYGDDDEQRAPVGRATGRRHRRARLSERGSVCARAPSRRSVCPQRQRHGADHHARRRAADAGDNARPDQGRTRDRIRDRGRDRSLAAMPRRNRAAGGERPRRAVDPRRQGVCDRHRRRGGFARHPGARWDGLHRGDRRRPASARRQDSIDLRRHQRHSSDRSGHAQAPLVGRRDGAQANRGDAPNRRTAAAGRLPELAGGGAADRQSGRQSRAGDAVHARCVGRGRHRAGARRSEPLFAAIRDGAGRRAVGHLRTRGASRSERRR